MSDARSKSDPKTASSTVSMWDAAQRAPGAQAQVTTKAADEFAGLDISPDFKPIKADETPARDDYEVALTGPGAFMEPAPKRVEKQVEPAASVPPVTASRAAATESVAAEKPPRNKLPLAAAAMVSIGVAAALGSLSWPSATADELRRPVAPTAQMAMAAPAVSDGLAVPETPAQIAKVVSLTQVLSSDSPLVDGKSLNELADGHAAFVPVAGLPDAEWRDQTCSACHAFDQATLCAEGKFYVKHGFNVALRTQHPYGGAFKRNVMDWAQNGCQ